MNKMTTFTIAIMTLGACATISAAEFDNEIKARQGYMNILSYNVGVLGAMARGKLDYDAVAATTAAKNLSLAAQMNNASMWPMGSDMANNENTVAKAELWANFDKAGGYLQELTLSSAALEMEAGKSLEALQAAMDPVGKTCSGCHRDFRAKR